MDRDYEGSVLEGGQLVILTVRVDGPNSKDFVGQVQEISEYGVRITLMDWIAGDFVGFDFFAPWTSIQSAIVATSEHSVEEFIDYAKGVSGP